MGVSKVIINGVTKVDLTSDTVAAANLLSGYAAHGADGNAVSGSITTKTSSDMTVSGATVTAPAGYYASAQSKSVASGTAGTPTATKGTVSSNSISVTPSVTNVAGYISGGTITGTAVSVSASELVSGTKSISQNGSNIDVTNYASVSVNVQPDLEAVEDVDPTESSQTITPGSSYDGLSSVQINAIPSDYVGSDIPQNDSDDLTASGATVTAPAGYYASNATKTISSGSATTPATTISVTPSISVNSSTGVITASASGSKSITPTVSAGYVSSGTAGTVSVSGSNTSSLSTLSATTYNTSSSDQTISAGKYTTGTQTIKAVTTSGISAANIKDGVTVKVGDANDDDRIAGVTGTFTDASTVSSGQTAAAAGQILSGYSAWVDGAEVKGSVATKTSSDMTVSGATVTASAGYYSSSASKSVASGSVTAPSTISGSSATVSTGTNTITLSKTVSVTPSVSTAGYISSGTAGNSSVSLTASVTTKAATTYTPGTSDQTIASGTYLIGTQTILGDEDLIPYNIRENVTIFGVIGEGVFAEPMAIEDIWECAAEGWGVSAVMTDAEILAASISGWGSTN